MRLYWLCQQPALRGAWSTHCIWNGYCQAAGHQVTLHQLRHTRATELVRGGVPLGTIRKVLGHRNIQSTLIYADVDDETVKRDLLEYKRRQR